MQISKKIVLPIISTAIVAAPITATISCSSKPSVLFQGKRTIVSYSEESRFANEKQRAWDLTVQGKNMISREYYDMTSANLFRERITQNSIVQYEKDGTPKEIQTKKEKMTFDGIDSVTLKQKNGASNPVLYNNADSLLEQLKKPNNNYDTMVFTVPKGIKYIDSTGNETKYNFKAIDYFYGMMRSLYLNEDFRQTGSIQGVQTGMPIMEKSYQDKMKNDQEIYPNGKLNSDEFNNANVYLYNLFSFDLKGTFDANTGSNADPDKFILKFNDSIKPDIIYSLLNGSTFILPAPSEKINEITGQNYTDDISGNVGSRFAILEYGKSPRTNGVADLSQMLTVSRYYWIRYDTKSTKDGGTGLVLKKNMHTYDKPFVNNKKNILKYQILINGQGDKDIFTQARQRSFLINNNSESILDPLVQENIALMEPILKNPDYLKASKSFKTGLIKQGLINPYYYLTGKDKVTDKESLFLFGDTLNGAKTNPNSDDEYFSGRGKKFRTLLNNSVNLYALSKEYNSADSKIKTRRNFEPNQPIVGADSSEENTFGYDQNQNIGVSVFSTSDADAKTWYSNNSDNRLIALKPTEAKFEKIKSLWKELADEARNDVSQLSSGDTFVFPLYDYRASDVDETPAVSNTFKVLVNYLNTITKGSGITFRQFDRNAGSKEQNIINNFESAPFFYSGAGPDYSSVISLVQQLISASYGYAIGSEILNSAFEKNGSNKHVIKDYSIPNSISDYSISLNRDIDITDLFNYISNNKSNFPLLSKAINDNDKSVLENFTITDWHKFKAHTFDTENPKEESTNKLLNEIDNLFQKYMFSISSDRNKIVKWTNLVTSYNMVDKLSIGYKRYTSLSDELGANMPVTKLYSQPWLHVAQLATNIDTQYNIIDSYVD